MNLTIYTFYIPKHDYDIVGFKAWNQQSVDNIRFWRDITNSSSLIFLATCQRVIWIIFGGDGTKLNLKNNVLCLHEAEARRYLLEIATGLHSANIGDYDILRQIDKAVQFAKEAGTLNYEARISMEDILREASRLRSRLGFNNKSISVASAVVKHVQSSLPNSSNIVLVGVGAMSNYLAKRLPKLSFNVSITNRTLSKARNFNLPLVELSQLQNNPYDFDAVISSTASTEPLFTFNKWGLLKRSSNLLLIDLALPSDSEQSLNNLPWINRFSIEFFLIETKTNQLKRQIIMDKVDSLLINATKRLNNRAAHRRCAKSLSVASLKLTADWNAIESSIINDNSLLSQLNIEQKIKLNNLLKRGRTLSFKALYYRNTD